MSAPTVVQTAQGIVGGSAAFANPVTAGNIVVAIGASRSPTGVQNMSGFTQVDYAGLTVPSDSRASWMSYYVVQSDTTLHTLGGDSKTFASLRVDDSISLIELSNATYTAIKSAAANHAATTTLDCGGSVTPTATTDVVIVGAAAYGPKSYVTYAGVTPAAGTTEVMDAFDGPHHWSGYRTVTNASGAYTVGGTIGASYNFAGVTAVFVGPTTPPAPTADFDATPTSGAEPLSVAFEDLSSGVPTSWLWDFGDGSTSTSQDPTHVYSVAGNYTVSLTATNAHGSDTETKVAYINVLSDVGYVPPDPGRAILEIKATPPGADRWDQANWDEAHWSSTSWQDVTPYGIDVQILWGSSRPELGILSTPDAASWAITFYDPSRILDPANADSPYAHDLKPLLPVRLRHNEKVIKQGYLESGSHKFSDGTGYWRVMDIQAVLANAVVPSDTTLSDTLFQRARDAIAAAGLTITVGPDPAGGDPDLAPWASQELMAWQWISDAAQQVLWVPYVRNDNTLSFRNYQAPMARGRSIGSPNLEDLESLTMHNGLFSIVGALELVSEGTDINRRELTPKPRYGSREYLRTDPTPNSGDWAQTVLNDRSVAGVRWTPGRVVPFTASETAYFAGIEALEQVSVNYPEATPAVLFDGIVIGGAIHVIGKQDASAIWDFLYYVAEIPLQPLTDDDDVSSYLTNDDDATDILYPDV